ncbi:hypothetical protein DFH06DRAFT_1176856, partial [Mycena polygramma]
MSVVYPTAISFLSSNVTFIRACLFILSGGSHMALAFLPKTPCHSLSTTTPRFPASAGLFVARRGPSREWGCFNVVDIQFPPGRDAGLERLEIRGETTRYVPCPVFRVAQRTVLGSPGEPKFVQRRCETSAMGHNRTESAR